MDGTLAYLLGGGDFALWVVPYLLLSATAAIGFLVVALRLEPPHRLARLRPFFVFLCLLSALFPLTSPLWLQRISLVLMWVPVNILFFTMVVSHILPPLTWDLEDRQQRLLTRLFPVVMAVFGVSVHLVHFLGEGFSQARLNQFNRSAALLFSVFSLAIVVWQVVSNTREKLRNERKALEAERNEARMQVELLRAEAGYQEALSAASRHRSRLASVSHDLKQPVASLRYAVDQMQRAGHAQDAEKLSRAVDYVASLSLAYVGEETAELEGDDSRQAQDAHGEVCAGQLEVVDAGVFARMLDQMFRTQAEEQGVGLRIACPAGSVRVEPLACMRIMTNLVANALAHAAATRVLVALRPQRELVNFMVLDNGRGMDEETLGEVLQAGFKGADSEGQGLGLGIVQELCRGQQMAFGMRSAPGVGTCVIVSLPRYRESSPG
jgi:signal transduction histidine kinase